MIFPAFLQNLEYLSSISPKGENECGLITLKKISDGINWKMSEFFKKIEDNNGDIKLIDE